MRLAEVHRKYILISVIAIIVIGFLVAKWQGGKQDEQFTYSTQLYGAAAQSIKISRCQAPLLGEMRQICFRS